MTTTSTPTPKILRTANHGTWAPEPFPYWGQHLKPVPDPDGKRLSLEELKSKFKVDRDFPKLPCELFSAVLNLFRHLCFLPGSAMEVQVVLLRDQATLSQWKVLVPLQLVTPVNVYSVLEESVDILTGETVESFPPPGWIHVGSAHSHNTMPSFFSSTDDSRELGMPGLHFVIGQIQHNGGWTSKASIVRKQIRYIVPIEDVVDTDEVEASFHPNCLSLVNFDDKILYTDDRFEPFRSKLATKLVNTKFLPGTTKRTRKLNKVDVRPIDEVADLDSIFSRYEALLRMRTENRDTSYDWFTDPFAVSPNGVSPSLPTDTLVCIESALESVEEVILSGEPQAIRELLGGIKQKLELYGVV